MMRMEDTRLPECLLDSGAFIGPVDPGWGLPRRGLMWSNIERYEGVFAPGEPQELDLTCDVRASTLVGTVRGQNG